jgi:MFS family permease
MEMRLRGNPYLIFLTLALAGWSYSVSQTMLIPSLPDVEAEFHTTPSGVTALMTSFWVAGAVTAGVFGRLGDMFGKRRMIETQMLLFSGGSLLCAVTPSFPLMIAGRVLMGCALGFFPLTYSLMRDELPPKRVVGAIALIGGIIAGGAAVGQSTGGLVSDNFGFRWIFWIGFAMGVTSIGALLVFVPESPVRTGGRVDLVGTALFAAGLAAPLIAIAQTPVWGWGGTRTIALLAAGAVLLTIFVLYERRQEAPLIHIPTLLIPRIRMTNLATFFVGFGVFGVSTILSQFFQEPSSTGYGPGASATQAGLFLVPGLVLLMITAPLAGRLSSRIGPAVTLRVGIALGTAGVAGMAVFHTQTFEMYLWPSLVYIGLGAAFGAMPTIVLQSVPPERSGQSAAINMIARTVGSAIGIQLAATFITASAASSGIPTEGGYTAAFALSAAAGTVAFFFALAIPRLAPPGRLLRTDGPREAAVALADAPATLPPTP